MYALYRAAGKRRDRAVEFEFGEQRGKFRGGQARSRSELVPSARVVPQRFEDALSA